MSTFNEMMSGESEEVRAKLYAVQHMKARATVEECFEAIDCIFRGISPTRCGREYAPRESKDSLWIGGCELKVPG